MKINTIDIDFYCKKLMKLQVKKSQSGKGVHITLHCKTRDCIKCRKKYDDKRRFKKDRNRPVYGQNVLFTKKKKVKGTNALLRIVSR